MRKITIERRGINDYRAFLDGDTAKWDAGRSVIDALGHLILSHAQDLGIEIDDQSWGPSQPVKRS